MSNTNQVNKAQRVPFSFAAIDSYVEKNIISPVEKEIPSKNLVEWGDGNAYPDYLLDLYNNVPTLRSIINGNIDFVAGDDVTIKTFDGLNPGEINRRGDTIREQIRNIAKDYEIYGGFALQIIRDLNGVVAEVYYVDMRYLRTNKEGDVFYYCENWGKRGSKDTVVYPAYMRNLDWYNMSEEERSRHASSILYVKNVHTQVYPAPLYAASIKACEIERQIDDFHLADINNHFVSSAIVNFNNGDPGDEVKKEIEADLNDKFCGASNGGRMMVSWNKNKESATDIVEFKVEDFGERYKALSEHSRRQIFCSFRAIPVIFGLTSEANTGFSTDEFEQSFKLYNRTQIRPLQRLIGDTYDKIFGESNVLTIKPFSLDGDAEQNVN